MEDRFVFSLLTEYNQELQNKVVKSRKETGEKRPKWRGLTQNCVNVMKYSWSVFDEQTLQYGLKLKLSTFRCTATKNVKVFDTNLKMYCKSLLCVALIYEAIEWAASAFLMQSKSVFIDSIAARAVS